MQFRTSYTFAACLAAAALVGSVDADANLVTNGGFETGDFTGWTTSIDFVFDGVDVLAPHSGNYAAFFGNPSGTSTISQTLSTTPGKLYQVDFWLQNEADVTGVAVPNSFSFNLNGGPAELTLTNASAFSYTHYTFGFIAAAATANLLFSFEHGPAFWDLDDVSVNVPEPGSLALVALAGVLVGVARRRRSA